MYFKGKQKQWFPTDVPGKQSIEVSSGKKKKELRAAFLNASQKALLKVSSRYGFPYGPERAVMEFSHMFLKCYVLWLLSVIHVGMF